MCEMLSLLAHSPATVIPAGSWKRGLGEMNILILQCQAGLPVLPHACLIGIVHQEKPLGFVGQSQWWVDVFLHLLGIKQCSGTSWWNMCVKIKMQKLLRLRLSLICMLLIEQRCDFSAKRNALNSEIDLRSGVQGES